MMMDCTLDEPLLLVQPIFCITNSVFFGSDFNQTFIFCIAYARKILIDQPCQLLGKI
jgi:hypothetical protein